MPSPAAARRYGLLLQAAALALSCAAHPAPAQSTAPPDAYTLHVSTQLVLDDASVERKRTGDPIEGLTPADFLLTEDGVPQTITTLSENQLPLSVLLLFDLTDTVHPVLIHLSGGAAAALRHLRPEDEVAVMTFSSHATLVQPFTHDRMTAVEGIDSVSASYDPSEPTFLYEDLWEAVAQSDRTRLPNARKVEIWLTDGSANDQDSGRALAHHAPAFLHDDAAATTALLRSGVTVSTLVERSNLPISGHFGDIERLAALTGGSTLHATADDIDTRLANLLDTLRARYTLGYRPSTPKPDGTVCHLKLTLSPAFFASHPGLRPGDVILHSRHEYARVNSANNQAVEPSR